MSGKRWPAYFVAFDLLQHDGQELLTRPYAERRALLENLFSEHVLTAPWTLCPMTTDLSKAREWLESWTHVSGVEGILIKPLNSRYLPGYRGWTKTRRRDTTEAIVGAITGTLTRLQLLVLGRHDETGRLRPVGRIVSLRPDAARQVAEYLTAAAPGHPWTGAKFSATWGSRDILDTTLVQPALVAEVSADRAVDHGGIYRHPLRFQRLRLDVGLEDVPGFGEGPTAAAG
ncbi:ATP-dependent DNA ligase [Streptomyces virginiae]|uniref:ATP-dependent DNA ligase n=1 Tax=Streptomyces virginiae TaxID=1961 RepID=UPI002DDC83C4|nr:ATP-dependent DNA ligase [Streptomyces virginiae]WSC82069.1 ATP-dependent DNA ligase [Streptomyces virginiae]